MLLNKNIEKISESGIRKVFDMASELGSDAINLSIGQPHFMTPVNLKQNAKEAIEQNFNSYMPTQGYLPLREKIADKLKIDNKIKAKPDDIIVTSGVSGALFLLFATLIDAGDEIIVPDPYFVMYKELANYFGGKLITHDTYPDFRLNARRLEKLITSKTKFLIINSPNNPTGVVYTKEELELLADIAKKHNLLIISDEIYESFDFENKFFSIGNIYNNTVTLNGFSKNLSITGWRLGYAHGPETIIQAMNKLQMYSFVCAPSIAQKAVADIDFNKTPIFDYKPNRDFLIEELSSIYEITIPEGAFYAFIKIPKSIDSFLKKTIENNLLIIPGDIFSKRNDYFRISFAVEQDILKKGIEILKKIC